MIQKLAIARFKPTAFTMTVFLLLVIYSLIKWFTKGFGNVSWEQIAAHLQFGAAGVLTVSDDLIIHALKAVCRRVFFLFSAFLVLKYLFQRYVSPFLKLSKLLLSRVKWSVVLLCFFYVTWMLVQALGFEKQLTQNSQIDFFDEVYIAPQNVKIDFDKTKQKNLVLIYVESLEQGYSNSTVFGEDLLSDLNELKKDKAQSFNNYIQAPETGWTMGGMVATQCGVPLRGLGIFTGNDMGNASRFVMGAKCLGDVLKEHGYTNVYMQGSSANFAGTRKFYFEHGYDEVYDKEQWSERYSDGEMTSWGLSDASLFIEGLNKLEKLNQAQKPFNLTLTTIDTHQNDGVLSNICKKEGFKDSLDQIVKCTTKHVSDFIKEAERRGLLNNTVLIVTGDHLAMNGSSTIDKLNASGNRHVFNLILLPDNQKVRADFLDRQIIHFDFYPSMLEMMGAKIEGQRLGVGVNFLGESFRTAEEHQNLMTGLGVGKSHKYMALWIPPH